MSRIIINTKNFLPHQLRWWELTNFIKLLVGGMGSGKTFVAVLRAIYLSYIHRPTPGVLISPTYQMLKRTIIPTLNEIINRSGLTVTYHKTDHEVTIHNWGGKFWLASGDEPDSLRGPNLAWVGIDEPFIQKRDVFDIAVSRVRAGIEDKRELFMTGTPESLNWGYDLTMDSEADIGFVVGRSYDNPYLGEDFVKHMEAVYTPEMKEAYIEGKFVNLKQGRAYKSFDRDKHITRKQLPNLEIQAGIDFNVDYMTAEVFINANGYIHVIDEIRLSYSNTFELADKLSFKYPNIRVWPDPSGSGRRTSATKSDHQILKDAGFKVMIIQKQIPVLDRINAVNSMLIQDRLSIEPGKCDWLIKDFERVVYKSGDLDKTTDVSLTHASDALGYAVHGLYPVLKRRTQQVRI